MAQYIIYTDFKKWEKIVREIGGDLALDSRWKNTYLALDSNGQQIGTFITTNEVWMGIVFKSHEDMNEFITGVPMYIRRSSPGNM